MGATGIARAVERLFGGGGYGCRQSVVLVRYGALVGRLSALVGGWEIVDKALDNTGSIT